jgi:hypothetical protein
MKKSTSPAITTRTSSLRDWGSNRIRIYPRSKKYGAGAYRHKPIAIKAVDTRLDNLGSAIGRKRHPPPKI